MEVETWDVVVIGGGTAAIESAVACRQAGLKKVLVIEKAPESQAGGNARFSHTGFRFAYSGRDEVVSFLPDLDAATRDRMVVPSYRPDDFVDDLMMVTDSRIDRDLAVTIAEDSNAAVHWVRDCGVPWELGHSTTIGSQLHFEPGIVIHPAGGGLGQLRAWKGIAAAAGVQLQYSTPLLALEGSERGVTRLWIEQNGVRAALEAAAIFVCSGGFQANREMRARYLSGNADLMKVRGSRHNTGEVLRLCLGIGARSSGHWQGAHATPIDRMAPEYEVPVREDGLGSWTNRYSYMFGITVNRLGRRFFDEGESYHSYTYAKTGAAVLAQPGGGAYQIFDRLGSEKIKIHAQSNLETKLEAPTIKDLAGKIGINPIVLSDTIAQFNNACDESISFDASCMDGKSTIGLDIPKSNWAVPIIEPPFRAYPVTGGITFTFGGLEIDRDARVIGIGGSPIPGLYAVGDVTGIFYGNYPSCTGQTRNAVFARRGALHAANSVR